MPKFKIITPTDGFKIQPEDLDTTQQLWDAFDNMETEISARYVVELCQKLGGWHPFTREQIEEHYRAAGHRNGFHFNRLIRSEQVRVGGPFSDKYEERGGDWIVEKDGKFYVTDDFICRFYKASPAKPEKSA